MSKIELQIPKWIKRKYKFEERETRNSQMLCGDPALIGILKKKSYFCSELRRDWNYSSYTFQHILDTCRIHGDIVFFNENIAFHFIFLKKFIWLFNPKYAIIEVNLSEETPLIISSPHIDFELV